MITSEIGFVLCRIASVYFFVAAVRGVSWISLKAFLITGDLSDFALGLLLTSAPAAIAGILLWRYSDRIARIPEKPQRVEEPVRIPTDKLLEISVFFVGLYAVLIGLVDAIDIEAIDWMARSKPDVDSDYQEQALIRNWTRRVANLLQIILGVGLIYWRSSVVAFAHRSQKAEPNASQ
jgi:hypothetical protein